MNLKPMGSSGLLSALRGIIPHRRASEPYISQVADVDLLRRYLRGDDRAFSELFDRHNHRLYLYCRKLLGDGYQAEDLVQEMWERLIRLRSAPQEIDNPLAFLFRIARNLCLNHLKAHRRHASLSALSESELPTMTQAEQSDLEEGVQWGLARLPFSYREVLVLNVYCGYRFEEIATMLDASADAVWMRASRARARLRQEVISRVGKDHPELQHYHAAIAACNRRASRERE